MSLLKLSKILNTTERSVKHFQKECWRRGFACPRCGGTKGYCHRKLKNDLQKYRCEECRHVFSDQSTTLLRHNKTPIRKVLAVQYLSAQPLPVRTIATQTELNKDTVYALKNKLRKARASLYQALAPLELKGTVEMDETKIAGKWFWGARERGSNNVIVQQIPNRSEPILTAKIWKHVREQSTIITDEWLGYYPHPRFYTHLTICHSKRFVDSYYPFIHTNTIENLWKQLKRHLNHFHVGVRLGHINDYINEYFYLKNHHQYQNPSFFPLSCPQLISSPPLSRT